MRTIWNGNLSFGLITIPVGLAMTASRDEISFRTLHRECGTPIKQRRWCPFHEREVQPDELVKGWEVAKGEYVLIEEDELQAAALPDTGRELEIAACVPREEIDELLVDRSYYLAPSEQPIGQRTYQLLRAALEGAELAAVCYFTAWGKGQLCAIKSRPDTATLLLQTLRYPADLIPADAIETMFADVDLDSEQVDLARELVMKLYVPLDRLDLTNRYQERVQQLVDAKLTGATIVRAEQPEQPQAQLAELDIAGALRKSVRTARRPKPKPKRKAAARV